MDEHNLRFFLICTQSVAGALPLGIILTSDEQESTLKKGFEMFKSLLPIDAFFGKGPCSGSEVIMTDNSDELRNSLRETWPKAKLLLCLFHVIQQVWRWLYEKSHGITPTDRVKIMTSFRFIVYAASIELCEQLCTEFIESEVVKKYENAVAYFTDLITIKASWAVCYRKDLPIRGTNTNNYVEAQFLVMKDTILMRTRQFNVNMLLDKVFNEFEDHFKNKLLAIADGTFDGIFSTRFKGISKAKTSGIGYKVPSNDESNAMLSGSLYLAENLFSVPSRTKPGVMYVVDMSIGQCECPVGKYHLNATVCIDNFVDVVA